MNQKKQRIVTVAIALLLVVLMVLPTVLTIKQCFQ